MGSIVKAHLRLENVCRVHLSLSLALFISLALSGSLARFLSLSLSLSLSRVMSTGCPHVDMLGVQLSTNSATFEWDRARARRILESKHAEACTEWLQCRPASQIIVLGDHMSLAKLVSPSMLRQRQLSDVTDRGAIIFVFLYTL